MPQYGPIKLKRLQQPHPQLDVQRTKILHAMYRGGHHLLKSDDIMKVVFPKYSYEKDAAYVDRKARAFYENLFAMVINQISAGLAQDPVHLQGNTTDPDYVEPDEYWKELMDDAGAPVEIGGDHRSFDQIMRDWCVEALTTGRGWLQADLPATPQSPPVTITAPDGTKISTEPPAPYVSLKDQEDDGALRAYLCTWSSAHVTDWEEQDGSLVWVRTYECVQRAPTPDVDRTQSFTHRWTIWDADGATYYDVEVTKDKPMPNEDTEVTSTNFVPHTFGIVPWLLLDFCAHGGKSHLHVGDLLESLVRAHMNRTNGENFQWTQSNFQQLYEFLAPEISGVDTVVSEAQSDPNRANRTARAPGAVHVRGAEDRAEFVGPDMSGAAAGQAATQDLRDSVLRVTQQMALSQDTSGAMLRRSGDSKQQDQVATEILLGSIGKRLLTAARLAIKLLAIVRGDEPEDAPAVAGYERFDVTDVDDVIQQSVLMTQVEIPSATYRIEQLYRLAVTHLGDSATEETRMKIREELELAITQDQIMAPPPNPFGDDPTDPNDPNAEPTDEGDDGEEQDDPNDSGEENPFGSKPPKPAPPKPGSNPKKSAFGKKF